jgi:hypothetical protein
VTTIDTIRTDYLNPILHRVDGTTRPWGDTELNGYIADAITDLWPANGKWATGDVATDSTTQTYTAPTGVQRISRIDLVDPSGLYVDRAFNWRLLSKGTPPTFVLRPLIGAGLTLRVSGWGPFKSDASDLPDALKHVIAYLAASLAYGAQASLLTQSELQQGLDQGQVVDYPTTIGLGAYWQKRADVILQTDDSFVTIGPRAAYR